MQAKLINAATKTMMMVPVDRIELAYPSIVQLKYHPRDIASLVREGADLVIRLPWQELRSMAPIWRQRSRTPDCECNSQSG